MQKIVPFLWFDNEAEEAAGFYTSIFTASSIGHVSHYGKEGAGISGRPEGSVMTVEFELDGEAFTALNGGPYFKFSPAISFFVSCEAEEEVDRLFGGLSEGGMVLMELGEYPFSKKFGWLMDKYGVSWQINLGSRRRKIAPFLMFFGEQYGKAEEAIDFYVSHIENSSVTAMDRYGSGEEGREGTVRHAVFSLGGVEFMAFDSWIDHPFTFTPAISFVVNCETQEEIDRLWEGLSEGGLKQQCGWLQDRYGISWQITPAALCEMMHDPSKAEKVMQALLKMKKLDIAELWRAHDQ